MYIRRADDININLQNIKNTKHYEIERTARDDFIGNIENKKIVNCFYVDKGHKNGPEYHIITDDALIVVLNVYTLKLCTVLIARPSQISRYYKQCNMKVPKFLIDIAKTNQNKGYNYL